MQPEHTTAKMNNKQETLSKLDIPALCKELVPTLRTRGVNGKAQALCPFHQDKNPSFSLDTVSGSFKCFTCGATGSGIIDLYMKVRNVEFKEAMQEIERRTGAIKSVRKHPHNVTGRYEFYDASGVLLYWKERIEPGKDGRSKEFRFYHGERQTGRGAEPCLYNLPAVIQSDLVFITEGEKQADILNAWGLVATTLDSGAQSKLTPTMIEHLAGKQIIILPDNDDPGREYSTRITTAIRDRATSLKVLSLPGLPEKGDVIEWANIPGNDRTHLLELVSITDMWAPESEQQECNDPEGQEIAVPPICSQAEDLRSFPNLYINTEKLLDDLRRHDLRQGQTVLYDALTLRIARCPGVRLQNKPRTIAKLLDVAEECIGPFIEAVVHLGLIVLSDGYLSNPVITEAYLKAIKICAQNAENRKTKKHSQ